MHKRISMSQGIQVYFFVKFVSNARSKSNRTDNGLLIYARVIVSSILKYMFAMLLCIVMKKKENIRLSVGFVKILISTPLTNTCSGKMQVHSLLIRLNVLHVNFFYS